MNKITRRQLIQQLSATIPGLLSAATLAQLLAGCSDNHKATPLPASTINGDMLTQSMLNTLSSLSDIIIPKTDTPGALEAGVPVFIKSIVLQVFTPHERKKFIQGLTWLDKLSVQQNGDVFYAITVLQQREFANELNAAKLNSEVDKLSLLTKNSLDKEKFKLAVDSFAITKSLTIFGYCSSEIGATQLLNYNPIPGRYDGCVPMEDIGTTWATR